MSKLNIEDIKKDETWYGAVNRISANLQMLANGVCCVKLMPEIVNYTYNSETGMTKIKWSDKTETTVYTEIGTIPDQFTGFVVAYAKKAAGNTSHINNLFEKWAIKKPIKDKIAEEKRIAQETEEKRIAEKRKVKREKWLIRKEALRIKREYEARKLANEKYGVPLDED